MTGSKKFIVTMDVFSLTGAKRRVNALAAGVIFFLGIAGATDALAFHEEIIEKPVNGLIAVTNFPEYEKVPIVSTIGKDVRADIRLYAEAGNPKKDPFAVFNIALENRTENKVRASFQAVFYDAKGKILGVAGLGTDVGPKKKTGLIAGMQYVPPVLMQEIKSVKVIYYEWAG